jgi:amidase
MTISPGLAMSWDEWAGHDAVALGALVKDGQVSPRELARQVAAGVVLTEPHLDAVLEVFDDILEDPNQDRPDPSGPLYGVPIFLKDIGSRLKGRLQESGTRLLEGYLAPDTDPLVENYLRAGLIPLGRSTTPEFGMTFDTVTDYLGRLKVTRNPWDLRRTSGGSSGGSAALVAAGVTPISMASDGGGSTRFPASFCGLVGLKPSRGRLPMPLTHSEFTWRIAVEGVVTRTVRDTAAVYDYLVRIPNGGTFIKLAPPARPYSEEIRRPPPRLRIALSTGRWGRVPATDPEVIARTSEMAKLLAGLGHDLEEIDDAMICDWELMWSTYQTQWVMGRAQFRTIAEQRRIDPASLGDYLNPMTRRHLAAAERYDKFDLWKAMANNNLLTRAVGRFMERYDLLLTPTAAIRVPQADGPYGLLRDEALEIWINRITDACRYTMPGNEVGLPAISLPAGWDPDGVPVGVMLYANFGREDLLLAVAAEVEAAKPDWFDRRPPCHVSSAG